MSDPYVGEIRMFAGNFPPSGWMFCAGQILPIADWDVLFNLIGTTYGGDGQNTFALPDLQGRVPMHQGTQGGNSYVPGQAAGTETVTLTTAQLPAHTHAARAASTAATTTSPTGAVWADGPFTQYASAVPDAVMNPVGLGTAGGTLPHENMPPFLAISFIISMFGVYPSQN